MRRESPRGGFITISPAPANSAPRGTAGSERGDPELLESCVMCMNALDLHSPGASSLGPLATRPVGDSGVRGSSRGLCGKPRSPNVTAPRWVTGGV